MLFGDMMEGVQWFLVLVGPLILFHELGHFLAAKAFGVRVLRFSIGFGPRLFGFTRGGTEYRVSLLMVGGYVKMHGDTPGLEGEAADSPDALNRKPLWQRSLILFAGPFFNFLLALVVYFTVFLGEHTFISTQIGAVSPGGPAWQAGLRPGDKLLEVDGIAVEQWRDLRRIIETRAGQDVKLVYDRYGERITTTAVPAGHSVLDMYKQTQEHGRIGIMSPYVRPVLAVVDPTSPAAKAGLQTGDEVVRVADRQVQAWHDVRRLVAKVAEGQPVQLTVSRDGIERQVQLQPAAHRPNLNPELQSAADLPSGYTGLVSKEAVVHEVEKGSPAERSGLNKGDRVVHMAAVEPDGTRHERPVHVWFLDNAQLATVDVASTFYLTVQRGRHLLKREYQLEARIITDDPVGKGETKYVFGASNDPMLLKSYTFSRTVGPLEALHAALFDGQAADGTVPMGGVMNDATLILDGLSMMLQARVSLDNLGGPIVMSYIAKESAKRGARTFLKFLALISVNLGLLNLLPIPVLDGGHLMFFGIEAVRGRPPSPRVREVAHLIGFVLLVTLMIFVFANDFLRFIP